MFTHHEQLFLQATERRLALAVEARRDGPLAALRRAKRQWAWTAQHQVPARASRAEGRRRRPARPVPWLRAGPAEGQPLDDRA